MDINSVWRPGKRGTGTENKEQQRELKTLSSLFLHYFLYQQIKKVMEEK